MQRVASSETAPIAVPTEGPARRPNYQGAGRRLAAGGLASQRRVAVPAAAPAPDAAMPPDDAPEWDPILPHAWARSRPVVFISNLMCDPPRPNVAEGLARARQARVPQAIVMSAAAATVCTLLLYWGKSHAALLDIDIGRLVQSTQSARARTTLLRTEWALLNSPDRLKQLAEHYLALQPIAPQQYAEQVHLHERLPSLAAAPAPEPAAEEPAETTQPQVMASAAMALTPAPTVDAAPPADAAPGAVASAPPAPTPTPVAPQALADAAPPAPPLQAAPLPATPQAPAAEPREAELAEPPPVIQPKPQLRTLASLMTAPRPHPAPIRVAAADPRLYDRSVSPRRVVWSAPVVFATPGILRVSARVPAPPPAAHTPPPVRLAALPRPQLPRWLTEQHTAQRTPVTMSEKPHFLDVPRDAPPARAPTQPAFDRPAPEPKIASVNIDEKQDSADQPQQAEPRQVRRYTYAAPAYGRYPPGYPNPYAYQQNGGYYGGSPYGQPYYPPAQPGYYPYTY